jgi:hypothetical protein
MSQFDGTDRSKSLDPTQVHQEAHKLETIADNFLSGNNEAGAFEAWQKEMTEISKHGMDSIKAVFKQIQSDSEGVNPLLPHVTITDYGNGVGLLVFPSVLNTMFGLNYRDIGSGVGPDHVFSSADAGRNIIVGQHKMEAFTSKKIEP